MACGWRHNTDVRTSQENVRANADGHAGTMATAKHMRSSPTKADTCDADSF